MNAPSKHMAGFDNSARAPFAQLVDAAKVASLLGVTENWVRDHSAGSKRARGAAIPSLRLGRYTRYDLAEVNDWLTGLKNGKC